MADLHRAIPGANTQEKMPVIVVLEDIRSGLNIGSVFRTADAFNVEEIILAGYSVTPPHREILKTALDATLSVKWSQTLVLEARLKELKNNGYKIAAVEQVEGSIYLQDFKSVDYLPLVLLFGNEVHGVSDQTLSLCDFGIEVPQSGIKHSLNIAVCAGVVLWQCYQQISISNYTKSKIL
ncbi:MAG: TrmH family RNA methyltransferase [Saprospiraceae bacterium]|nr:TrmH family RNA methyltransferase [Saprospiraceae bacterium]